MKRTDSLSPILNRFTIIWQAENPIERDWVDDIFGKYIKTQITDGRHEVVMDDCILCDAFISSRNTTYYDRFRGKNAFLVHFLDENYEHPFHAYQNFKATFRSFWSSVFNPTYIKALPLGYCTGIAKGGKPKEALERRYLWSFTGQMNKSSRPDVVKHFAHLIPNYCYPTDDMPGYVNLGMAKPGGLTPDAYRNILDETIFAPSPMGNVNLECFRVYEALERGAIPIVERRATLNYFKALLGDHPIPTVRNWSEAASMIESLLKKPAEITSLQQRCFTWWQSFKSSLSDEIGGMIMARLGDDTRQNRSLYAARAETRWWQFSELLRHHNASAIRRRITKQANRLLTTGQLRVAFRPGNSAVRAK